MKESIRDRVLNMANMMLLKNSTVRDVAKEIGYSKSTVHKDLREKLPLIDYELYLKVCNLLDYNKKTRHIRGGEATKIHYALLKLPLQNHQELKLKSAH